MPHQWGQHIVQNLTNHHPWPHLLLSILDLSKKSQHSLKARAGLSSHILLRPTLQWLIWPMNMVCGVCTAVDHTVINGCVSGDWSLPREHKYFYRSPEGAATSAKLLCLKNYSKTVLWNKEHLWWPCTYSCFSNIYWMECSKGPLFPPK